MAQMARMARITWRVVNCGLLMAIIHVRGKRILANNAAVNENVVGIWDNLHERDLLANERLLAGEVL